MTTQLRTDANNLAGAVAFKGADNIKLTTAGPELLGIPKAPTAAAGNNTTQIATTAFVQASVAAAGGVVPGNTTPGAATPTGAPGVSLAYSREDHLHLSQTAAATPFTPAGAVAATNVQNAIVELDTEKVAKAGDTMTGPLTVTAADGKVIVNSSNTQVQLGGVNGCIEVTAATPFIDFKNSTGEDYDWRIDSESDGDFSIKNVAGKYVNVKPDGTMETYGTRGKAGFSGAWQTNKWNMFWGGSSMQLYVDDTNVGTISTTSDARIKKDIVPVDGVPATKAAVDSNFMQLEVVTYKFKDAGVFKDDGITRYGFVAQQVKPLFPSVVSGDENDPYSVLSLDPMQLIAILTQELQTLRTNFDAYVAAHP